MHGMINQRRPLGGVNYGRISNLNLKNYNYNKKKINK